MMIEFRYLCDALMLNCVDNKEEVMYLRPSKTHFTQDSINNVFDKRSNHAHRKIGETLDALLKGQCDISDVPTITVVNRNGVWYTVDNRRLWVFRKLEELGECTEIRVQQGYEIHPAKFPTRNGGTSVLVRRDAGGYCWKTWSLRHDTRESNSLRRPTGVGKPRMNQQSTRFGAKSMPSSHLDNTAVRNLFYEPGVCSSDRTTKRLSTTDSRGYTQLADRRPSSTSSASRAECFRTRAPSFSHSSFRSLDPELRVQQGDEILSGKFTTRNGRTPVLVRRDARGSIPTSVGTRRTNQPSTRFGAKDIPNPYNQSYTALRENSAVRNSFYEPDVYSNARTSRSVSTTDSRGCTQPAGSRSSSTSFASRAESFRTTAPSFSHSSFGSLDTDFRVQQGDEILPGKVTTRNGRTPVLVRRDAGGSIPTSVGTRRTNQPSTRFGAKDIPNPYNQSHTALFENSAVRNSFYEQDLYSNTRTTSSVSTRDSRGYTQHAASRPSSTSSASRAQSFRTTAPSVSHSLFKLLDPAKVRYTKDTIKTPPPDSSYMYKYTDPILVYRAFDEHWALDGNRRLWSYKKARQYDPSVKVLANLKDDEDEFLEKMRVDRPWLTLLDIIQMGETVTVKRPSKTMY